MFTRRLAVEALLSAPLFGSMGKIDRGWFHQALLDEAASRLSASLTPNGFFQPTLDRAWRPAAKQTGTLVSQARLVFVMAAGHQASREQRYREAARVGAGFLLDHFRDREHGGYVYSVTPSGDPVDSGKDSYGHAFVIFGLSHAARATGDERFRRAALEAWAEMKARLRDDAGFVKPRTTRDYSEVKGLNSQNPMMHLFEALLALYEATDSRAVFVDAQDLAERIYGRLFQEREGYLPELFDANWRPLEPERRGHIELGHQFEWAFLLSRAVEMGMPRRYLTIAGRLLDYGMAKAYDSETGGVHSWGDYHGTARKGAFNWWEQAECLRALMHHAERRGRTDLWPAFDRTLKMVKRHFIDPEYGGWYEKYDPARARGAGQSGKGTVWITGYHVVSLYAEALRLTA